ncbi:MAG TPA: T9SS type A sorting domain-containing protein [Caldithrix abyssi]|uniref:T9SS type A sorting domain-containing protein n=1 Tax=Caldithrix abyssi TaxID=187145 RepID=A0A7V4U5M0_CALAY|nr:T9SS type A sorting domain-containing protein [Caldithrix abyssi]
MKNKMYPLIIILAGFSTLLQAGEQFPWPVTPFDQSHEITGTFCEFRDTGSSDHFHNGTDIPKADGEPVYAVKSGTITSMATSGSNAYVRVNDIAYVHIQPNPNLSVGDNVVAQQTVLGTIYPGMGHVHFTYGYVGSEKNAMLPNSGLTPLDDPWAPIIRYTHFYVNKSTSKFPSEQISGAVDIVVKVDEQNGPPTTYLSRRNNGIYKIGYKILSADTGSVVYEPPNNGLRFRFDNKPSNDYVHNVFFDQLSSTTSHVYIVTNNIEKDNYWNTTLLDSGQYVVMVFAEDTRGNADTMYTPVVISGNDVLPPATPVLRFTGNDESGIPIGWYPVSDADLKGYRFYFSTDAENWTLHSDENNLPAGMTDTTFNAQLPTARYFRISAVDETYPPNESGFSDVYGAMQAQPGQRILIVDGFDRTESSGSWHEAAHWFAAVHGMALAANGYGFDCTANEALLDGSVSLSDYDAVIWLLGDESTHDETFSDREQALVRAYLEAGGNLMVSGSEIAWDLDTDNSSSGSTVEDETFLHNYLKADYAADDAGIYSVSGSEGGIFQGLEFTYGSQPYTEDYPDALNAYGGSQAALIYKGSGKIAAVQYEGTFGQSSAAGKLVYLAFPFETIDSAENRVKVMGRIASFFFDATAIDGAENPSVAGRFALLPNYPNPFNPSTTIRFSLPQAGRVRLAVFDIRGRLIKTLKEGFLNAGSHRVQWDGRNNAGVSAASGMYVYRLQFDNRMLHGKMLLLR